MGPWCITFEFEDGDACRIDFEQYHRGETVMAHVVLAQVTTLVFARSGRLNSEMTLVSRRNISRGRPT
jgi:hypothetical protein